MSGKSIELYKLSTVQIVNSQCLLSKIVPQISMANHLHICIACSHCARMFILIGDDVQFTGQVFCGKIMLLDKKYFKFLRLLLMILCVVWLELQ